MTIKRPLERLPGKEISDKWLTDALTSKFSPDEDEVYDEFRRYIINKPLDFYRAKTTVPISAAIVLSPNGTIKILTLMKAFGS